MSRKLLQKNFCAIPWSGFELEPNGNVKNCIISKDVIGNIHNNDIETIIKNNPIRKQMLNGEYPSNCEGCYLQEKHRPNNFDSISSRLYYAKQLGPKIKTDLLDNADNFDLTHIDLRWSNSCNQACVYCGSNYSSKWAMELGQKLPKNKTSIEKIKEYVYNRIDKLENVYLAGGEPLLMKENKEFLELLLKNKPDAVVRVNTNLSRTNTGVFETVCKFKNVHWTVSVETIEREYEYVRFHGKWQEFVDNLQIISKLGHKISFNMLYFILNYESVFDCIKYLQSLGFHNNSFVLGPLTTPASLNILNLPQSILERCKSKLQDEIDKKPGFLLQNSLENCLSYLTNTEFYANIESTLDRLKEMDKRRQIDSRKIFTKFYDEVHG